MALKGTFNLLKSRRGRASLSGLIKQRDAVSKAIDRGRDQPLPSLGRAGSSPGKGGGNGSDKAQTIDALAVLGRASATHADLVPFDEQLLAALGLRSGFCVDMATGEGKTLVAILAAGAYAASGRQVHVLCPNDYLAARDHALAAKILAPLGIGTAVITEESSTAERQHAYRQGVLHSTVHEVAYDLMRDNLVLTSHDLVSPALDVAIVDEVDAVLLDEATQPLVIARNRDTDTAHQSRDQGLAELVAAMRPGQDFTIDGNGDTASFTEDGIGIVERHLGIGSLFDPEHVELATAANLALHAAAVLQPDVDYVVAGEQISLISATRGRVMQRQRWPEGLHRAVEVKEHLTNSSQVEVLDQLTIQEVAKAYGNCIGMSGSATLAAEELHERYGLLTAQIPQRLALQRIDEPVRLYASAAARDVAAVDLVDIEHASGRPILIGTQSVAQSETFAALLSDRGIATTLLNAKNPQDEATIIAEAGTANRVTISTQMAGRGTDIVLTDAARDSGGLLIVGIECYPSSRLDLQLRGRAGRQGDPGASVILASVDDPLYAGTLPADGVHADDNGRITLPGALEAIAHQQRAAEGRLLAQHEHAWAFTRVISEHRSTVLVSRKHLLDNPAAATRELLRHLEEEDRARAEILFGDDLDELCARLALVAIDDHWSAHLAHLTALREGIHLRRLARLSPLAEFNRESRQRFEGFLLGAARSAADNLREALQHGQAPPLEVRDPGALWAYRVMDPNWGSPEDKFVKFVGDRLRGAVLG